MLAAHLQRTALCSGRFAKRMHPQQPRYKQICAAGSGSGRGGGAALANCSGWAGGDPTWVPPPPDPTFTIVSEEVVQQRYLTLYNRAVRFPASGGSEGPVHEFDIVGVWREGLGGEAWMAGVVEVC